MPGNESVLYLFDWLVGMVFFLLLFFCLFFFFSFFVFMVFFVLFGFWFFETGFLCIAWRLSWSVHQTVLDLQRYACLGLPSSGIKDVSHHQATIVLFLRQGIFFYIQPLLFWNTLCSSDCLTLLGLKACSTTTAVDILNISDMHK